MAYKVFFAFQMDIDDKYGKGFIQSAIEIAAQRFKEKGIEIVLDFGFRGTPGTPLLIEEMLNKSADSDMVIVDLTFTSSKIWSDAKRVSFFNKEIRLLNITEDKKSPNPNVLLETGYAWAKKGTHRTLAIMNTSFGLPELLPVDLKGFRWPITFSLDAKNYSDRKSIRKELSKDLYNAINSAINSEARYQQEKLSPIVLRTNWRPQDFRSVYSPTNKAKKIIKQLRIDLENREVAQRIVGPKNSGKTRMAYELYKRIDEELEFDDNHEKVLYYDLNGGDLRSIESKLIDLRDLNQRKILVLDNCPLAIHNKVFNEYFYDSNISLLTIGDAEDGKGATCYLDRAFADEVIEKLSNENGNPKDTNYILNESNGNIRNAIALIGKIPEGENALSHDYQTKWGQILGPISEGAKALKVLEQLSLFTHVGYSNQFEKQAEVLMTYAQIERKEELNQIIGVVTEIGIVKITGDFISLESFVEELATRRLASLSSDDFNAFLIQIAKLGLSKQFGNRLIELKEVTGSSGLFQTLSAENGVFRSEGFLNSRDGARILMSLAEVSPQITLGILQDGLSEKPYSELKEVDAGRRYIVWTLERLLYRDETFQGAARILFRLAVAENERISNNATYQFCQIYQVYLSGTKASLIERFELIRELSQNATQEEKEVIIKALDVGLKTSGFTRMAGAEVQAGEKFVEYVPNTNNEVLDYWRNVIELLKGLKAFTVLINKFYSQAVSGNAYSMLSVIEEIIIETGKIGKELRQQFEYIINSQREVNFVIQQKAQEILTRHTGSSMREQLESKVALAPYSSFKDETGNIVVSSERKVVEFASMLMNSGDESWLNEIDVLLQNEQRFTFHFGKELANHNIRFEILIQKVIDSLARIPHDQQNNSLIVGYLSNIQDNDFKREVINRYLSIGEIAYHAIQLTRLLEVTLSDLEKLKKLIEHNPNYIVSLQFMKLIYLDIEEIVSFVEWVKNIEPRGWWVAVDLLHDYIEVIGQIESSHLDAISSLLIKPGFMTGENMHSPLAIHHYAGLLKVLAAHALSDELVTFLSNEILSVSEEISLRHEYHLQEIVDIMLESNWESAWGIIGQRILDKEYYGWYNLKGLLHRCKAITEANLFAWMEQHPTLAPQKVVGIVDLTIKHDGLDGWSPLVMVMFDKYFGNSEFLSTLSSELHSYFWSGSLIPLLESRLTLFKQIVNHEEEAIRLFAEKNIKYYQDDIQRERRNEENYGLDY